MNLTKIDTGELLKDVAKLEKRVTTQEIEIVECVYTLTRLTTLLKDIKDFLTELERENLTPYMSEVKDQADIRDMKARIDNLQEDIYKRKRFISNNLSKKRKRLKVNETVGDYGKD